VSKKHIYLLLKIAVVTASFFYIFYRLKSYHFSDFFSAFDSWLFLVIALILMPLNWILESLKWRILLSDIQKISLSESIKGVLAGVTVSVFTPNRVGELGGRVVVLQPENRVKGVFATLSGSISQLTVTILAGIFGLTFFFIFFSGDQQAVFSNYSAEIIALSLFFGFFFLWLFFHLHILSSLFKRIAYFRKHAEYVTVMEEYSKSVLRRVLAVSCLRYVVFVSQFYVLLVAFGVELSVLQVFVGVSLTYLAMAIVPGIALAEIGIRGSLSMFFLGIFSQNEIGILAASTVLWLINLAIPAIIGTYFFVKSKLS